MNSKVDYNQEKDIEDLKYEIQSDPEDPENYWKLGNYYDKTNNHQYAIAYYHKTMKYLKRYIRNNPKDDGAYNIMGLCLDNLCLAHLAMSYYKKAIALDGQVSAYYYNLSLSENSMKDYANSIKHMEKAIELNPNDADLYNQLCIINTNAGNNNSAIHDGKTAILIDKKNGLKIPSAYYYNVAYAEKIINQYDDGIKNMDKAIGTIPTDKDVPSSYKKCLNDLKYSSKHPNNDYINNDTDYEYDSGCDDLSYNPNVDYVKQLNEMIGLKSVKSLILTIIHQVEINEIMTGKRTHGRMHLVFEGDPGTGKTTVAKLFCRILYQKHIITKKKFTCINATQLVFSGYGKGAKQVRKIVHQSAGGVLFIDEAYYLAHRTDGNSLGQDEAINALLSAIDKHDHDLVVIMAGYTKEMEHFLNKSNPGLQSRFPLNDRIVFPDYSSHECMQILDYFMYKNGYGVGSNPRQLLKKYMHRYIVTKLNDSRNAFANARTVENVFDQLKDNHANQLFDNYSVNQVKLFKLEDNPIINNFNDEDITNTFKCFSFHRMHDATTELGNLIGLNNVKSLIHSCVNSIKVSKFRQGNNSSNGMDLVFEGNPGTGKTTVANLFCKLLYQNGLVKSNNYVHLSAPMLESSVVGQSAKRLRRAFYNAKGGVLFIDEAYALLGSKNKNNLIPELVSDLTDYKNSVVVILAGYPKAMEHFLKFGNAGLSSRFSYRVPFKDYSNHECLQILYYGMDRNSLQLDSEKTKKLLESGFSDFIKNAKSNDQYQFANARTVNNFLNYLKRNFADRLGDNLSIAQFKSLKATHDKSLNTIKYPDVKKTLQYCKKVQGKMAGHSIGFR